MFDALTFTDYPACTVRNQEAKSNYILSEEESASHASDVALLRQFTIDAMKTVKAFEEYKGNMIEMYKMKPVIYTNPGDGCLLIGEVSDETHKNALAVQRTGIPAKIPVTTLEANEVSLSVTDVSEVNNPILYDIWLHLYENCMGGSGQFFLGKFDHTLISC